MTIADTVMLAAGTCRFDRRVNLAGAARWIARVRSIRPVE